MKKLYTLPQWKRRQKIIRKKRLRRRAASRLKARRSRQLKAHRIAAFEPGVVTAPPTLNLMSAPDALCIFLADLREMYRKKKVILIDMREVIDLGSEAVSALLSILTDRQIITGRRTQGFSPRNQTALLTLVHSGFFNHVQIQGKKPDIQTHGINRWEKERRDEVDSEVAKELVDFATQGLYGTPRREPGTTTTLIELMSNTHQHADPENEGRESWWASVYIDADKARFTFVDNGIGILESGVLRFGDSLRRLFGIRNNTDFLRKIFLGEMESRTRNPRRGRGLPKIHTLFESGSICNLRVLTNNVYADLSIDNFLELERPFAGTLVTWEIQRNGENHA